MTTFAKAVKTSVNVTTNSPSQYYTHPDHHNLCTYYMTPGFKPFSNTHFQRKEMLTKVGSDFCQKLPATFDNTDWWMV